MYVEVVVEMVIGVVGEVEVVGIVEVFGVVVGG